jgi:hypothetical protein
VEGEFVIRNAAQGAPVRPIAGAIEEIQGREKPPAAGSPYVGDTGREGGISIDNWRRRMPCSRWVPCHAR